MLLAWQLVRPRGAAALEALAFATALASCCEAPPAPKSACNCAAEPSVASTAEPEASAPIAIESAAATAEPGSTETHDAGNEHPAPCGEEARGLRLAPLAAEGSVEVDLRHLFAAAPSAEAARIAIETHVRVLASENVVARAVRLLGLDSDTDYAGDEQHAVERLSRTLRVRRRGASAVIEVGIEDVRVDPMRAAAACNAVMQAYLELRLELEPLRLGGAAHSEGGGALQGDARILEACTSRRRTLLPF